MVRDRSLDIAVTGISARFPGSPDIDQWWAALTAGQVLTTRYDRDDLIESGVPGSLVDDPDYVPVRGHLADADCFDNTLFRVSSRDAEMMDPQHRLMLEAAWAAMEDAGSVAHPGAPVTAVYASDSGSGYLRAMLASGPLDPVTLDQAIHGTEPDFIASLISYKLGLTGPAIGVRTACSSSLVGVHLAIQALLNGDCDQAVVVAAGIDFPQAGHLHVPGGIQSASGACRPFDENADGVVAGSGVAAVVLRRLADALEDGPDAYGVILGTAINNDGAAKAGYYAPSVTGQEAVIRAALRAADVDARTIGYLEAHATGTRVGDPIEWSAASAALRGMGARPGQVAVGALKANIGHLDAAAGLASLIKAMLVVREGLVPPVAGFTRLNPLLETAGSPLFVPAEATSWTGSRPRRAGVSSFGIGGTNVHLIIEEPPGSAVAESDEPGRPRLVLLSAADPQALTRSAVRLGQHLSTQDSPPLADVSYTLAEGRVALTERLAVAGRTNVEVAQRLSSGAGVVRGHRPPEGPAPLVLLFPGQGAQYPGMAVPFAESLPGFTAALDQCLDAFPNALAGRLRRAVLEPDFPRAELDQTDLAQPALLAVEHAAATALTGLGLAPVAVLGHSLGEITAAAMAGIVDLPDAARVVTARGRAMQACPVGAMLALGCAADDAAKLVAESGMPLELAAVNGPVSSVVAGEPEAVQEFQAWLGERVFSRVLPTGRAFHSALIEPALPELARELAGVHLHRPSLPLGSNVTGRILPAGARVATEMFVEQARQPVRFAEAMADIAARFPNLVAVEVGPGRTLTAMARAVGLTAVALSPTTGADAVEEPLTALGMLWTIGQPVDLTSLCGGGRRVHLPCYPFAGPRWMAPEVTAPARWPEASSAAIDSADPAEPATVAPVSCEPVPDAPSLLASLWTELLGHTELTDESDFFLLGGDSMLITQLARKVNQKLGVRVPLRDMLAGRTLGRQTTIVLDLLSPRSTPVGAKHG